MQMKKFTLFAAVAALTASSAIAAAPQQATATKATKAKVELTAIDREARVLNSLSASNRIETTAEGDDQVTVDVEVSYVPTVNSFYLGFSPETYGYRGTPQAFTGIRNKIGFQNLTQGADAFNWTVGRITGLTEDQSDYTYEFTNSTDQNFFLELTPNNRYTYPTLAATVGADEFSFEPEPYKLYHCGGSPAYWGYYVPEDPAEIDDWIDLFGVSACTAAPGATLFPEFMICRPEGTDYTEEDNDANGTPINWYAYADVYPGLSDIKITAFGTMIPAMPSPYMLNAMWAWINTVEAKEDVALDVKVYAIDEEGQIDTTVAIGKGQLNFAAGAYSMSGAMPITQLIAVDENDYEMDTPICIPAGQAIMVCIEGLDNENILRFDMVANPNCQYPVEKSDLARVLFPYHAYTFMDCTVTGEDGTTPEAASLILSAPYRYYTDSNRTGLINCSDFAMYFDVEFPTVMNPVDGTANFTVEAPVEGGEVVVPVYCDYVINSLVSEYLVSAASSEWITFTTAFDEVEELSFVTITAEALPEGETGRTGYVVFEGFAIDFHIAVKQGEESGIESIEVRPVAKGTKFYDLQGRQLQTAPAAGMYIESVDGKATKRIAR